MATGSSQGRGTQPTASPQAQALRKLKAYVPEGREKPAVRASAILRAGDQLSPGDIQLWDILCLPKAFAEVVQVTGIQHAGTEEECWNCEVLPTASNGKMGSAMTLSLKQLNGPKDQTGEQRPMAIVRIGQALNRTGRVAVLVTPEGQLTTMVVNRAAPRQYAAVPGIPLNQNLFVLAAELPAEVPTLVPVER